MNVKTQTMNRLLIFSFVVFFSFSALTQTVKVNSKSNRIKGNTCAGFLLELNGKADDIENSLVRFLKDYGKPRSTTDYISVSEPTLGGNTYEGKTLFGTVTGDDKQAQIWIGIDTVEWKTSSDPALGRIEKMAYQFGVTFYKDQIQKEIDESQRAFDATEKQKNRLANQNKDLTLRLGYNEQERVQLEKQLQSNSLEHAVLLQRIENNKKSQDSVANAGIQIKKVLEAQREKQKKVN